MSFTSITTSVSENNGIAISGVMKAEVCYSISAKKLQFKITIAG